MKKAFEYTAAFVIVMAMIWVVMWTLRAFSNSVTTVTVEEVAPGVSCAKMVTADGAAISCWKE
jgi:hypothetical protein